jgi:uncharacterized membrane protein (DUF373 family)
MARRFIVLDFTGATSAEMFGLTAVTLALGGTCWLMREREAGSELPARHDE